MGDICNTYRIRNRYKILVENLKMRDTLGHTAVGLNYNIKINPVT
jgi:hypothetical protein